MASFNPLVDFAEPVTRQDLFDMWNTAAFSEVGVDDFADGFMPVIVGSSFSEAPVSPQPGQHYWHQQENIMYVYHDVIDNTGVSLWLAIGPDKFETAMLTSSAVAVGEGVELIGPDRTCRAYIPSEDKRLTMPSVVGFNQSHINAAVGVAQGTDSADVDKTKFTFFNVSGDDSGSTYYMGETAVTNEWIRVGIDGLMYMGSCPGSHPSVAMSTWTSLGSLMLSAVPGLPGGVHSPNSNQTPVGNFIGGAPFWNVDETTSTRSEPWWLTKAMFMPRHSINGNFNT